MHIQWTKGLKGGEKEQRVKEVKAFDYAFSQLQELLEVEETTPDYDCPSWAHKQADQNGYNRAIRKVINLMNVKG